jgi:hypothetical protein
MSYMFKNSIFTCCKQMHEKPLYLFAGGTFFLTKVLTKFLNP